MHKQRVLFLTLLCRLFVILIVAILLTSCQFVVNALSEDLDPSEDEIQKVRVYNYSDESLYVLFYETDNQNLASPSFFYEKGIRLNTIPLYGVYDSYYFYKSQLDRLNNKTIQIMVLKSSTMDKYGVEKLKEANYCDTMYVYNISQLNDIGFCVKYTGE